MDAGAASGAVAALAADPSSTVLLFDFDGTLAPIVSDPAAARPAPGVVSRLAGLAARYRQVGVVSGRPVEFLAEHLPPSVALSGLYGIESRVGGVDVEWPGAAAWRQAVADAVYGAELALANRVGGVAGMRIEPKGLSVTFHYRTHPHLAPAVDALARRLGEETGLEVRSAKMSVELHPPIPADKGMAVRALAEGAAHVLFAGDDLGDLPAFAALADLRAQGVHTVRVAVQTSELPEPMRAEADVVVDGSAGVLDLLEALLAHP